jgi:hypothetical protein
VDEYRAMHQTKNVYDVMKHEISAYTDKVLETLETKGAAHGAL